MTWQELDQELRNGAKLVMHLTFGAWIEKDGKTQNVNLRAARAVTKRDLVLVSDKRDCFTYAFRSKYPKKP